MDPGYALLMFSMWWVMMVAMMLPSAAPMLLLFARVNRKDRAAGCAADADRYIRSRLSSRLGRLQRPRSGASVGIGGGPVAVADAGDQPTSGSAPVSSSQPAYGSSRR